MFMSLETGDDFILLVSLVTCLIALIETSCQDLINLRLPIK